MQYVIPILAICTGLAFAGLNAVAFAEQQSWGYMVLGGLFPPLFGLTLWWTERRKSPEARRVADMMIWAVLFACAILASVLGT